MLTGLIVLLLCQLVGEVVVRLLGLSLPGPVLGMVLMLVVLQVRRPSRDSGLVQTPMTLLRHLPLLYVPAGVGVVAYLGRLGDEPVAVTAALAVSWLAGLVATAAVVALTLRLSGTRRVVR